MKDKATWEMEELLNYDKLGLKVKVITNASYEKFAKRGFEYLKEIEGPEVAQWSKEHTGDIELEKKRAAKVVKKDIHIYRVPTKQDIKEFLVNGWLVMLSVNSRKLNGKTGYFGHRVLVYAADGAGVTMHDPGLPAYPARRVNWQSLEGAWADPNEDSKMLIAVKTQKS